MEHSDVFSCFGTTVGRDLFYMMTGHGEDLGSGAFRVVYPFPLRPDLVLKFETASECFQNIREWETWEAFKNVKKIAKWLAPCEAISPCGCILAMKKTTAPKGSDFPKKLPRFLTDLKRQNFGMYGGRLVCHDYGLIRMTLQTETRKAKWWGREYE